MTSSKDLRKALKGLTGFRGVFSSDMLPGTFRPGECLIANYDPSGKPGSHWIAMMLKPGGEALYFDSFGMKPDAEDNILHDRTRFGEWLRRHAGRIRRDPFVRHNKVDLQSLASNACGDWSAFFCMAGALPEDKGAGKFWRPMMVGDANARDRRVVKVVGMRKLSKEEWARK